MQLQGLLSQSGTVKPLVAQLLMIIARISRQHDYDSAVTDSSKDLPSPRHVASAKNMTLSISDRESLGTVMCRICEQQVPWEVLTEHTKQCARDCRNASKDGSKKVSISDFEVLKAAPLSTVVTSEGVEGATHNTRASEIGQ